MAVQYYYNFAYVDPNTKMCLQVNSSSDDYTGIPNWVEIPVYDENYLLKYYIDGNWYEDAEGTIPWTSSLL